MAIRVRPASLDHPNFRFGEVRQREAQKVGRWKKISVEDGDEFALRGLKPCGERASLVAGAVGAMQVLYWQAQRLVAFDTRARDLAGFVCRIVEHLNVQQLARVIKARDRVHQTLDHV